MELGWFCRLIPKQVVPCLSFLPWQLDFPLACSCDTHPLGRSERPFPHTYRTNETLPIRERVRHQYSHNHANPETRAYGRAHRNESRHSDDISRSGDRLQEPL